jgi:DNA ligase-1
MTKRHGIMLCYPLEEKRLNTWPKPWIVQPKLDGIRCRVDTKFGLRLLTSEGNVINSVPHIMEQLTRTFYMVGAYHLDGELYHPDWSFEQICSVVLRDTPHRQYSEVVYNVFDYIPVSTTVTPETMQAGRISTIGMITHKAFFPNIKMVPSFLANSMEQIDQYLDIFTSSGYEGIIVRNKDGIYQDKRSTNIMKFKPHKSDQYKIIDYQEEVSKDGIRKGSLGAFVLTDPEGNHFNVGSGFTKEQRINYWHLRDTLIGKIVEVKYQNITDKGVPRFPVFSCIVVTDEQMKEAIGE